MDELGESLNETIAAAVKARIEAKVTESLASDEVIGRYVTAALSRPVEERGLSRRDRTSYLDHVIRRAIEDATRDAVTTAIEAHKPQIQAEVERKIAQRTKAIAKATTDAMVDKATWRYGLDVSIDFKDKQGA